MNLIKNCILFISIVLMYSCSKGSGYINDIDQDLYNQLTPQVVEELTDEELMDLVQKDAFNYFWEFAEPNSGMARERFHPNKNPSDVVTTGGSAFGIMAIIVGVERAFITREAAVARMHKISDFLLNSDRFHGAFPHWYHGSTGKVQPFSADDDGGDIVETSFMAQGLIAARNYYNWNTDEEKSLRDKLTKLWETIEWDWYTKDETTYLWHWSPNYGFSKNFQLKGWMETLVTYVMGAASPTHPIDSKLYHSVWAKGTHFFNGATYYNQYKLPLGPNLGGPLFFAHYSFLGLNPKNLRDQYANYWEQNRNHTLINRAYCIGNPKKYPHYSENCWGLTASYSVEGYSAHSPTNDRGVITPTAALSSMPYTPTESLMALRHFYYKHENLWGPCGPYDAFSVKDNWISDGYLAIDQGPIIVMIENYRTGLIWNLFMKNEEVQKGLGALGFTY